MVLVGTRRGVVRGIELSVFFTVQKHSHVCAGTFCGWQRNWGVVYIRLGDSKCMVMTEIAVAKGFDYV